MVKSSDSEPFIVVQLNAVITSIDICIWSHHGRKFRIRIFDRDATKTFPKILVGHSTQHWSKVPIS